MDITYLEMRRIKFFLRKVKLPLLLLLTLSLLGATAFVYSVVKKDNVTAHAQEVVVTDEVCAWGEDAEGKCQRSEDVILFGATPPQNICVWGTNEEGGCEEVDPCVYSRVECLPETRYEDRIYEVKKIIERMANEYGVSVSEALAIAECESNFDERARNPNSTAKGVYQFIDGTWASIKAVGHQYDAEENIKQFMIWYPIYPGWWSECNK